MSEKDRRPPLPPRTALAVVNWEYPDRSVASGCPMDYGAAQAVARAYQERYPSRRSWISIPAPLAR